MPPSALHSPVYADSPITASLGMVISDDVIKAYDGGTHLTVDVEP
ncbi:hypothetical protein ACIQC5_15310 [Paenarthrobacter sp. NPDC092416]